MSAVFLVLQAAVVLGLEAALSALGDPVAAAVLGGGIFASGLLIALASRGLPHPTLPRNPHVAARLVRDLLVRLIHHMSAHRDPRAVARRGRRALGLLRHRVGAGALTLLVLLAVPLVQLIHGIPHASPHHHENVRGIVLSLASGIAVIYLSSLTDRFFVAPRLTGPGRACLTSLDGRWRTLTQIWLVHRLAAYLSFRLAVAASLAFGASALLHKPSDAVKSAIAGVVLFVVGYYVNRITPIAALAFDPPIYVGDKVILAEEYDLDSPPAGYFVVDVSLDGFKLIELDGDARMRGPRDRRTHDRILALTDVPRLLRARRRFTGCVHARSGCGDINPYCEIYKRNVAQERRTPAPPATGTPPSEPQGPRDPGAPDG